jgi:hypothetical protein
MGVTADIIIIMVAIVGNHQECNEFKKLSG